MMRHPFPRRFTAWPNRLVAFPRSGASVGANEPACSGPLAPAHLQMEPPDATGVRPGLVAYYRDLLATGSLEAPDRFAAAEARLLDTLE